MLAYAVNNHSIEFHGETKKDIQKKIYDFLVKKELKCILSDVKSIDVSFALRVKDNGRHEIIARYTHKDGSVTNSVHGYTFRYEDDDLSTVFRNIYTAK